MRARHGILILVAVLLVRAPAVAADPPVFEGPVPRADCGPGSLPESPDALQGEVTVKDRDTGRSQQGYTCNLQQVGNDPGNGASWQNAWYDHCDYYDTRLASQLGTQVIDVSDPAQPKTTEALTSISMLDPWESLSTTESRKDGKKLLAGVYVNGGQGAGFMDVYDVKDDCAHPKQLFSGPIPSLNHEGNWSMDGMTYYASSLSPGSVTALDMTDPTRPQAITTFGGGLVGHGLSTSDDGNRLYFAAISNAQGQNGLVIFDTSQVQSRQTGASVPEISHLTWSDGSTAQHTIPITVKGHPYIVFVDEGGMGMARIIDIADERNPKVIAKLKLEIDMPQNDSRRSESAGMSGSFGYNAHYCGIDRRVDPTALGCSYFASGIRIFDIRDPYHPHEIAYFNPGGTGQASPPGSQEGVNKSTAAYTSARVRFIPDRSEIWFTDQNKGFFTARFTNGVWPFSAAEPSEAQLGLPAPAHPNSSRTCVQKGSVTLKLSSRYRRGARSATVLINGKAIKSVRGGALRRPIAVRLPQGHSVVRVVVQTRAGKRFVQTREYTRCTVKVRRCTSRRALTIHLDRRLRDARVTVSAGKVRIIRGRRLRARLDLHGISGRTVTVRVVGRTADGRTLRSTRRFRTCTRRS